jgi:predicted  nucleic acid-binding Zn-ribbon protein
VGAQGTGAAAKSLTGQAPGKGALMSRDELRACLKDQAAQKLRGDELEKRRTEVSTEADTARRLKDEAQAERDAYQAQANQAQAFKDKARTHGERVELYNKRFAEFQASPPVGAGAERERGQLEAEGDALAKADAALKAEGAQLNARLEQGRAAVNQRIQVQQAAAAAASERSKAFDAEVAAFNTQVSDWRQRCGDRPYREADEKAVRAGQ